MWCFPLHLLQTNLVSAICLLLYSVFMPWYAFLIRCASVLSLLVNTFGWEVWSPPALQAFSLLRKCRFVSPTLIIVWYRDLVPSPPTCWVQAFLWRTLKAIPLHSQGNLNALYSEILCIQRTSVLAICLGCFRASAAPARMPDMEKSWTKAAVCTDQLRALSKAPLQTEIRNVLGL